MKKNVKNEELQSRREFFKRAAKGALPILGAIVLAGAPDILNAAEKAPMGCMYCQNSCSSCATLCSSSCKNSCNGFCRDNCTKNCKWSSR